MKGHALCSECLKKVGSKNLYAVYREKSGNLRFLCRQCYTSLPVKAKRRFFSESYNSKKRQAV